MQEMLRALNHRRSAWLLSNVHESLDAKEPCAEVLRDPVQKKLRLLARRGLSRMRTKFSIPLPSRW